MRDSGEGLWTLSTQPQPSADRLPPQSPHWRTWAPSWKIWDLSGSQPPAPDQEGDNGLRRMGCPHIQFPLVTGPTMPANTKGHIPRRVLHCPDPKALVSQEKDRNPQEEAPEATDSPPTVQVGLRALGLQVW